MINLSDITKESICLYYSQYEEKEDILTFIQTIRLEYILYRNISPSCYILYMCLNSSIPVTDISINRERV